MPGVTRRDYIKGAAALGGVGLAGCFESGGGDSAVFVGPLGARPEPNSQFFANKRKYTYIYVADDDGTVWTITEDLDDWVQSW